MMPLQQYLNQVITIKVNSGEEVIAKVINVDETSITLAEPLSVAPGPQGVGLMPTMFTTEPGSDIVINRNSITMIGTTNDQVKSKYIEATTGLQVPSKKLIMG